MKEYLDMVKFIMDNGIEKPDRTNTGTLSVFGYQSRYALSKGFPLLTTKKVYFRAVVHELLWFISGNTNIKYLVDNKVNIWNEWPYKKYQECKEYKNETLKEFVEKIKNDNEFAKKYGNLGPVYGKQWRNFNGVDQLKTVIKNIKENPYSRRHIVSSWNPAEIKKMALPPCHALFQFYVNKDKELSCLLYQRSADVFLGVPFNIASYSLLLLMVAKECGLKPGTFIHTIGDCHVYLNHIDQINLQLTRIPRKLPKVVLNSKINSIFDYKFEDIILEGYNPHPLIKGKVAV